MIPPLSDIPTHTDAFSALRCAVLIPTYNNAATLATVIDGVSRYTHDICVVVDGATDSTPHILARYPYLKILSYTPNRGKGYALQQGFALARQAGYDYVITIDSDGQHYPDDLPIFLEALSHSPDTLYVGARNMDQSTVPRKSSIGNRFSNFWYWVETGIHLPDTQSGYRLYPIRRLAAIPFYTHRFEFEIEVIVRAAWAGIPVKVIPVRVYYPPSHERISHFRPWQDFTRITLLNVLLVLWTFAWIKPRNFFRHFAQEKLSTLIEEHIICPAESPAVKALSVGIGVFFGIAPFWGFQMILVFAIASLLRLNKAIAIIASNISIPPMIPLILYGSYKMGGLFMSAKSSSTTNPMLSNLQTHIVMALQRLHIADSHLIDAITTSIEQYIVGSFVLALLMGVILGVVTYIVVSISKRSPDQA